MKKEDGFKEEHEAKQKEEDKPKKIRNRPLFYVKVSIQICILFSK